MFLPLNQKLELLMWGIFLLFSNSLEVAEGTGLIIILSDDKP